MRVALVLRSGGEYKPMHVDRLYAQIMACLPDAEVVCLSDVEVSCDRIKLQYEWPGWWSKMELFRPDIVGDLLYFDLDTSIVGSLKDIAAVDRLTVLRDFYRPHGLGSGMMFLPEFCRPKIWHEWMKQPAQWMREHRIGGDQIFLERFWLESAARWQDICPGQVLSYKADDVGLKGVPADGRVVCFHGKPRPWAVGW